MEETAGEPDEDGLDLAAPANMIPRFVLKTNIPLANVPEVRRAAAIPDISEGKSVIGCVSN
jgi:hypothetical protein